MKIYRIGALFGLMAALFFLAGCSGNKNLTPTTDPKAVYTQVAEQAAQTAQSQLTNVAKLTPRVTNTPVPTDVPEASPTASTPNPTITGTLPTANPTTAGTAAIGGTPQLTAVLLPTDTKQASASPDKMLYVSQTVADGSVFKPGDTFTQSWVIKNVGTTTWANTYRVRFYGGERFGVQDYTLPATVDPNKSVTLTVNMTAPSSTGQFNSIWVLTNNDGANFGYFTFNLEVK